MIIDDVLPTHPAARHIVVALGVLQLAGIDATIAVQPEGEPVLSITLRSATAEGRATLQRGIQLALDHEWQARSAELAVLQAKDQRPC